MAGYRRFIAYLYEYRKGKKESNCGFVKVEVRDQRCSMEVHLHCPGLTPLVECKVYGLVRKDGLMNGVLLGSCETREDIAECLIETDSLNMGDSEISLGRMGGMVIVTEAGGFFGTEWDDQPVRPENFRELRIEREKEPGYVRVKTSEMESVPIVEEASVIESGSAMENNPVIENDTTREMAQTDVTTEISDVKGTVVNDAAVNSAAVNEEVANDAISDEVNAQEYEEEIMEQPGTVEEKVEDFREDSLEDDRENVENENVEPPKPPIPPRPCPPIPGLCIPGICPCPPARPVPLPSPIPIGEEFSPFDDGDMAQCRKIHPQDFARFPRREAALRNNRFLQYGYYNFGHLLLCRREDGRYLLGVPGGYDQQERFMANMFGFPYFKESPLIELPRGKGGYWYRLINASDFH